MGGPATCDCDDSACEETKAPLGGSCAVCNRSGWWLWVCNVCGISACYRCVAQHYKHCEPEVKAKGGWALGDDIPESFFNLGIDSGIMDEFVQWANAPRCEHPRLRRVGWCEDLDCSGFIMVCSLCNQWWCDNVWCDRSGRGTDDLPILQRSAV